MQKWLTLPLILVISGTLHAIPVGQWECRAFDKNKRGYKAYAPTLEKALNKAYAKCRESSNHRSTCKTAQSFCQQGPLSVIDDRCVVSTDTGRTWNTTGRKACKTALSLCTEWQFNHGSTMAANCMVRHW